jgi:hypothetical protein
MDEALNGRWVPPMSIIQRLMYQVITLGHAGLHQLSRMLDLSCARHPRAVA